MGQHTFVGILENSAVISVRYVIHKLSMGVARYFWQVRDLKRLGVEFLRYPLDDANTELLWDTVVYDVEQKLVVFNAIL